MKIKSGLLVALFVGLSTIVSAQTTKTSTPDVVVKNLYAAHNADRSPFFQTTNRALVDKYFAKDFADLIWNDAVAAGGEVGALGFDPLYNAQDTHIKAFKIGKPMYGEGNLDVADVPVTFKNMGKAETILFRLERSAARVWKISDIYYPSDEAPNSSLKGTYTYALNESDGNAAPESNQTSGIRGIDFLNYSYQTSVCYEDVGLPKTVKVRGGKFKDRDNNFFDVDSNETAYGDVNGDGSEDAVVLIRCGSSAGTLRAFEVHAYSLQNGQAKLLARLDSRAVESDYQKSYPDGIIFYAGETAPRIVNGHVIIEALADGSYAGPENTATFDYQLSVGKFVLRGKPTQSKRADDSLVTDGTFKGTLHAGKSESYMVYVGEESGDFAAFCFANDSEAGRSILAACKDGETCEFTGKVDQGIECKVDKETRKVLSASGRILSVKSAKSLSSASGRTPKNTPAVSNKATVQEKRDIFQLISRQDKEINDLLKESPSDADRLAQSVTVRKMDLNSDGQLEYVAVMEEGVICGALANCPHWIYRKTGGGYELLGHTRARTVIPEKASTNGYRDLRAWGGNTATEDGFDILKYDDGKYRVTDCFSRDNSGKVAKVKRVRCAEADEGAQ